MSGALRRYAALQARVRAWSAALLDRRHLEMLAGYPDAEALERELAALGWGERSAPLRRAFERILKALEGPPHTLVALYRRRYEVESLKALLRAAELGLPFEAARAHLARAGAWPEETEARALLEAPSLAAAVERLAPEPFGEALRRHLRAHGRDAASRLHLECVAERDVWDAVWAAVERLDRGDRPGARALLGAKLDAVKLVRALRLRERELTPEERDLLLPRGGAHLAAPRAHAALAREAPERWPAHLERTPYARPFAEAEDPAALERRLEETVARAARRALAGPPFRIALPLGYLLLLEVQASAIEQVAAARRFGRAAETPAYAARAA